MIFKDNAEKQFLQSLIDAMPYPVVAVDVDVRIIAFNRAAQETLFLQNPMVINRRGGDVLNCLHSRETAAGCGGSDACGQCVVRNAVDQAYRIKKPVRKRVKMKLLDGPKVITSHILITAAPFDYRNQAYTLLTLEDVNELMALKNYVPICANCKNIRDEREYWIRLEEYFKRHLDLDFSHGICPKCIEALYPKKGQKK